jgi:hypothetical protein
MMGLQRPLGEEDAEYSFTSNHTINPDCSGVSFDITLD